MKTKIKITKEAIKTWKLLNFKNFDNKDFILMHKFLWKKDEDEG